MNFTKLEADLQATLGLVSQFLFTNTNFSKLVIYTWDLKKIVSMLIKEKVLFISIWDLIELNIWWAKNQWWKVWICASPTVEKDFWYALGIFWKLITLYPQAFSLVHLCWQFVQKYSKHNFHLGLDNQFQILSPNVNNDWHLINMRYNDILSYSSTIATLFSWRIKNDIK